MPEISVVVPVYKVEPYLKECVDSILAQTFTDFEVILVDDGSPDRCGEICDQYAALDQRVRVIHKENGGLSDARNAGIDISSGYYISFIDSDDIIPENYLRVLYCSIITSKSDISVCRIIPFDEKKCSSHQECLPDLIYSGREAVISLFNMTGLKTIGISSCNKLYRKNIFENVRFPIGMIHEDEATTPILLFNANRIAFSEQTSYFYRTRDGSIMHSAFTRKRFDAAAAVESLISFFESNCDEELLRYVNNYFEVIRSKLVVNAFASNASTEIPNDYKISLTKAILNLHRLLPKEKFEWYLAMVYPTAARFYAYTRKLKSLINGEST